MKDLIPHINLTKRLYQAELPNLLQIWFIMVMAVPSLLEESLVK